MVENALKLLEIKILFTIWAMTNIFYSMKNFIYEVKKLTLLCKANCNYTKIQFFATKVKIFHFIKVFIWPCFVNKISFSSVF